MAAYLTVDEFAAECSTDDMTIRRLIDKGFIEKVINLTPESARRKLRIHYSEIDRVGSVLKLGNKKRGKVA